MTQHETARQKKNKLTGIIIITLSVMMILLLLGTLTGCAPLSDEPAPAGTDQTVQAGTAAEQEEAAVGTAYFITPDAIIPVAPTKDEPAILIPEAPVYEGYTFIGWRDENGNYLGTESIEISRDAFFSAVYVVALRTDPCEHRPYMTISVDGYFRPYDIITRGEATDAIYSLLAVDVTGDEYFDDAALGSPHGEAAAALKLLGVIDGAAFRPEDGLTYREFADILAAFYPECAETAEFDNIGPEDPDYSAFCLMAAEGWLEDAPAVDPDTFVTRLDFAATMNRVLGRGNRVQADNRMVGTVMDVAAGSDEYCTVIEAVIEHSCAPENSGEAEIWTDSVPLPALEEGFCLIGTALYYVESDGSIARNTSINGFSFADDGRYTSGDAQLDALMQQVLGDIITEDMERMDMLRAVYLYCTDLFYVGGNIYDAGTTDWIIPEAYGILSTGRGNCYSFAAAFCSLSRALGFDTTAVSGFYRSGSDGAQHHAWTQMILGDEGDPYIFDPQLQNNFVGVYGDYDSFYMIPHNQLYRYGYIYPDPQYT